ncbi:unnamed protein product [Rotaria socialis]|uniref:Uncharacterized protein n=1 Tax=Rotaria socialis TaxID=392032 RepID=A0A818Z1H5_9BILA|nr:unnamed protein product [Rotaria socialis]
MLTLPCSKCFGACNSILFFIVILRSSMFYPLAISCGFMGLFLLPLLPVVFEYAVECTYPVNATWSTGLLLSVSNVLGGIFVFILEGLIKRNVPEYTPGVVVTSAATFILCVMIIGALPLLFYYVPYLRLHSEVPHIIKHTANTNAHLGVNEGLS